MEIFFPAFRDTLLLVAKLGTVMFISVFGIEVLMQMGLMKHLRPIGKPVARLANLPSESALTFLTAIGSMIAAHVMAARFHMDGKLTDRELAATGVLNTVPFHFPVYLHFRSQKRGGHLRTHHGLEPVVPAGDARVGVVLF